MKKVLIATAVLLAIGSQAFAAEGTNTNRDAVTVFPPITQDYGYMYSAPIRVPANSPAAGNLAQVQTASDAALTQASSTKAH